MADQKARTIFDEPGTRKMNISDRDGREAYYLQPSPDNRITIYLPELPDTASGRADQTVPVIVNGVTTLIRRGEYVDVPYHVYQVLRQSGQYPNL